MKVSKTKMKQNSPEECAICGVELKNDNKGCFSTKKFPICCKCCTPENTKYFHTAGIIYSEFDYQAFFENLFKFSIDYSLQKRYKAYSRKNFFSRPHARYLHYVAKISPKDAKILEVGGGWGFDGNELKKLRPDVKYIGLDFSETCVSYAKRHFGLEYICGSANTLSNFGNNQFDLIFGFDTLEHLQNTIQHLANVHRILKLKGSYIFDFPNRFVYPYPLTKFEILKQKLTKFRTSRSNIRRNFQILLSLPKIFLDKFPEMTEHPLTFMSHPNYLFPQELFAILEFFNFKKKSVEIASRSFFGHFIKNKNELINLKKLEEI